MIVVSVVEEDAFPFADFSKVNGYLGTVPGTTSSIGTLGNTFLVGASIISESRTIVLSVVVVFSITGGPVVVLSV